VFTERYERRSTVPTASRATIKVVKFPQTQEPNAPLGNRQLGEEERILLEREVAKVSPGEIVGIDARQVEFLNYTFADECFGKLFNRMRAGELGERFAVFVADESRLEEELKDVSVALAARKLAVLCVDDPTRAEDWRIMGELPKSLEDTLEAVEAGDTNETLANRLGINVTTCNNRTDRLVKLRLLRRTLHQGDLGYKQYEFAPVLATS
jgi:hypothetical protein